MSLSQAIALHRAGRRREAQSLYEHVLRERPDDTGTLFAYGLCLLEQGALPAGVAAMRRLARIEPGHAGAQQALGKALAMSGNVAEAEAHLRRAVELAPQATDAWVELGALLAPRAPERAERVLRDAVARHPRDAALWCNFGNVLALRGRRTEATDAWRRALVLRPGMVEAELALALELRMAGKGDEAVAMLERAIARRPDMAELHYNLGVTYYHARRLDRAIAALERAASGPRPLRKAVIHLAQACQAACDWQRLQRLQPAIDAEVKAASAGRTCEISPFFSLSLRLSEGERAAIARAKARDIERLVSADRDGADLRRHWPEPRDSAPLRIGYLCSDFRDHPTSHLMARLFALHDRAAVHVTAYSYGPDDGSDYRRRVADGCDAFVELAGLDHRQAARRIAEDRPHILVDINGYITHSRPEIAAMRPAPVQATYLAFPGTTGAPFFDYALADRVVTPPASQTAYQEALVLLPGSYQVNDADQPIGAPTTRTAEALPERGFVFCCFCANFKVEPEVFDTWLRLLHLVPGSVLWLLAEAPEAERNLRDHARRRGMDEARLVFAVRRPKAEHLARVALADLFLDTLTYGAHTTASDALWAGVPVVSRRGDAFASRVGASLLQAVGLPELVVDDLAAYEATALRLAERPEVLADLRKRLAANRRTTPLFDTARFARGLEEAYRRMWRRFAAGENPALIDLSEGSAAAPALGDSTS